MRAKCFEPAAAAATNAATTGVALRVNEWLFRVVSSRNRCRDSGRSSGDDVHTGCSTPDQSAPRHSRIYALLDRLFSSSDVNRPQRSQPEDHSARAPLDGDSAVALMSGHDRNGAFVDLTADYPLYRPIMTELVADPTRTSTSCCMRTPTKASTSSALVQP